MPPTTCPTSYGQIPRPTSRIAWIDAARGIGIVLVVLGHVLGGLATAGLVPSHDGAAAAVIRWIYAFHMPLFFFLSGTLLPHGPLAPWHFVGAKLRTVAYPYVVWSLAQAILQSRAGVLANHGVVIPDPLRLLLEPAAQFWFLYVLFVLVAAWAALRMLGLGPLGLLAVALALRALAATVGLGAWGPAYLIARYAPWLALGALCGPYLLRANALPALPGARARHVVAAGLLLMLVALLVRDGEPTGVLAPLAAAAGIAAVLMLARAGGAERPAAIARDWGLRSLQIYVAHTMSAAAVRAFLVHGADVADPLVHVIAGVTAGIAGPLALDDVCRRIGFRWAFTWPAWTPRRDVQRHDACVPLVGATEGR
jgi:fucose 4-O-acetylase-like acetyltransferase